MHMLLNEMIITCMASGLGNLVIKLGIAQLMNTLWNKM